MDVSSLPASALARARALVDADTVPAGAAPADQALAIAWALKAQCYAVLNTQPQRAALLAQALRELSTELGPDAPEVAAAGRLDRRRRPGDPGPHG